MPGQSLPLIAENQAIHLVLDKNLTVMSIEQGLANIAIAGPGRRFDQLFVLRIPEIPCNYDAIRTSLDHVFTLTPVDNDTKTLRGFFTLDDHTGQLSFYGHPVNQQLADQQEPATSSVEIANHPPESALTMPHPAQAGSHTSTEYRLRLLSKVFTSVSDPILIEDLHGNVVDMNDEAVRAYGWSRTELLGRPLKTILPPDQHRLSDRLLTSCKAGREIVNLEGERQHKDGRRIPVLLTMTLLRDEDGLPASVVTIAKDISIRKQKEQDLENQRQHLEEQVLLRTTQLQSAIESTKKANAELQKVQERLSIALDSAQIGIWEFDVRTREETWDDRMYELFGTTKENAADPHTEFAKGVVPEDLVKLQEEIRMSMQGDIDYDTVYRVRWPDGSLRYIKGSGLVIRDATGHPTKVIGANYDITELKDYETNLHIAKDMAETANQAKSDFLARMSHEIRTPMNAVIGMTHLALRTELTAKQRDYIQKAHSSAIALLDIINDILDFSKIEAGKMELENTDFAIDEVLEQLSNIFAMKASEKGLELLFHVHPEVPAFVRGDSLRLRQILVNLISNAIKFSASGEIIVTIKIQGLTDDGLRLQFLVSDTGIGMTAEQQQKLFTSFTQADGSTTRKYGGTGLGLVICKRLVNLMQGDIEIDSVFGKGSTFRFSALFSPSAKTLDEEYPIPEWLKKLRVLIVDDSEVSRRIQRYALESFAMSADTVNSGEAALEAVSNVPPDQHYHLILMDLEMPGIDGIACSRKILADSRPETSPKIIMVTAYGQEKIVREAVASGIHGFLVKPVSRSALFDAMLECFGVPSTRRLATASDTSPYIHQTLQGSRVLLVEDNQINQQVAIELLEQRGLQVSVADNGDEGAKKALSGSYDIILMDIQMPIMDGYTAAGVIRKAGNTTTPIIAMTANAMTGDEEKSLAAGMNDHITKPIDPAGLFTVLTRWLKPGETHGHIPATKPEEETARQSGTGVVEIPCLDTLSGLHHVNNNQQLYLQLLKKFVEDHSDDGIKTGAFLKTGDLKKALRLVHTIKGIAGSIGAHQLQQQAALFEQALLQEDTTQYDELVTNFAKNLELVSANISSSLPKGSRHTPMTTDLPVMHESQLQTLLRKIWPHLKKRQPKPSLVVLGEFALFTLPQQHRHQLADLERLVKKYQFKEAEAIVNSLLTQLGTEHGG